MSIIKLEDGGDKYKVTHSENSTFLITHVLLASERFCSFGMWKEHGSPCVDAMVYFKLIKN
jgi:hypothetical protein